MKANTRNGGTRKDCSKYRGLVVSSQARKNGAHGICLDHALVRVEGLLNNMPSGFEMPVPGHREISVYEIPLSPCPFDKAVREISRKLRQLRINLENAKFQGKGTILLHLQVSDPNNNGFFRIRLPVTLLDLLHAMKMELEVVWLGE